MITDYSHWLPLYSLAAEIQDLAPWRFMEEDQLVGVQDPISGEIGFMSVMGTLGEHLAISRYPGLKGLWCFYRMHYSEGGSSICADQLLMTPQIMLSFEDRKFLSKEDRAIIKSLGCKFRGSQKWPLFRSYLPSLYPWGLTDEEMCVMRVALEQTVHLIKSALLGGWMEFNLPKDHYWILVPVHQGGEILWKQEVRELHPEPERICLTPSVANLNALRGLPKRGVLEMDGAIMKTPSREGKKRPFFPHLLLVIDSEKGRVLNCKMYQPTPSLESMWSLMMVDIADSFAKEGVIPERILIRSDLMGEIMRPLELELGIQVERKKRLKMTEEAMESLMSMEERIMR